MKKAIAIIVLLSVCRLMSAQEWEVGMGEYGKCFLKELVTVDEGDFVIGAGFVNGTGHPNGFIVRVGKDGNYSSRKVNLPGMMLQYQTVVQLDNGNYMVFGMCEDSLWNPLYPRYLRLDVLDSQLESVSSRTYSIDDEVFDCFVNSGCLLLKSTRSKRGTTLLAAVLSYYVEQQAYYRDAVRFYEFDDNGDIIQIVDNDSNVARASSIGKFVYEPHSDNLLMTVSGGIFPPNSGPGVYVVDSGLNIVGKTNLVHVQGGVSPDLDHIDKITCDGRWMEGDCMVFDAMYYLHHRQSFTYHTLYKMDSALNVHAELRLPPYDSCMYCPEGTSTAYIDDTTIFAFTSCSLTLYSCYNEQQANLYLVDKHLNLLGRKTIRKDDAICHFGPSTVFSDGGCVVPFYSQNGTYYSGEPFYNAELMKFRREDIEITWDVVKENGMKKLVSPYPNPTNGILNIPIGDADIHSTTLQIFDMKGGKWLDKTIDKHGNLITVDTRNLKTGLYVYKVVSGSREIAYGKFVKE